MYNADFGALSREERQRRQQLSPEARRAVRQGDAGQRRADRSTAQAATRERNLKFAAIRNERDPAAKQALVNALSTEDQIIWQRNQAAGSFVRETASTASREGGAQSLLDQGQAATTDRASNWLEQRTGIRLQLPGIRTTPQGGRWLNPDSWKSRNLKRIWAKGKKAAPGTVFFPKSRGIDVKVNEALDNLNAVKAALDQTQQRLPQHPELVARYNARARGYLEAASGVLRNAVYASGGKSGQAVDEFGAVVIYSFTTRNIKIPANSAGFVIKGGGNYIKWLKRKALALRAEADAPGSAPAVMQMTSRGLTKKGDAAVTSQAGSSSTPLILGGLAVAAAVIGVVMVKGKGKK